MEMIPVIGVGIVLIWALGFGIWECFLRPIAEALSSTEEFLKIVDVFHAEKAICESRNPYHKGVDR